MALCVKVRNIYLFLFVMDFLIKKNNKKHKSSLDIFAIGKQPQWCLLIYNIKKKMCLGWLSDGWKSVFTDS